MSGGFSNHTMEGFSGPTLRAIRVSPEFESARQYMTYLRDGLVQGNIYRNFTVFHPQSDGCPVNVPFNPRSSGFALVMLSPRGPGRRPHPLRPRSHGCIQGLVSGGDQLGRWRCPDRDALFRIEEFVGTQKMQFCLEELSKQPRLLAARLSRKQSRGALRRKDTHPLGRAETRLPSDLPGFWGERPENRSATEEPPSSTRSATERISVPPPVGQKGSRSASPPAALPRAGNDCTTAPLHHTIKGWIDIQIVLRVVGPP